MKRLLSIAFIALLLLNITGYYLVFVALQYQNDITMIGVLDASQHDPFNTITIKIPVSIPYMNNRSDYERIDGTFEHQGEHYRLVKQKFDEDTLTVVCVKDIETKRITETLCGHLKTFTDKPLSHGGSKVTWSLIKDYLPEHFLLTTSSIGWSTHIVRIVACRRLTSSYISTLTHPPER